MLLAAPPARPAPDINMHFTFPTNCCGGADEPRPASAATGAGADKLGGVPAAAGVGDGERGGPGLRA
jgi:hypothetical protein